MNYEPIEQKDKIFPLDCNVYEASKYRIKKVIPKFDNICVAFTGGKDSTVVLYLVEECMRELGRTDKIKVTFRDEEFVPQDTLNFVDSLVKSDKYEFFYYCLPTLEYAQFLGKNIKYIQWDTKRRNNWERLPPEYAITTEDVGNVLLKDPMYDEFRLTLNKLNGSVVMFNGYRTEESIVVYQTVVNKPYETYLNDSKISSRLKFCKPIYDWKPKDIFLYLFKNNLPYNPVYDNFLWCGIPLRSNIPLEKGCAKSLVKYKSYDPDYYNQLVHMFPDLEASSRYSNDMSISKIAENYGNNPQGMIKYVMKNTDDSVKKEILETLKVSLRKRNTRLKNNELKPFGGFPYLSIWLWLVHSHRLVEVIRYSLKDFLFEGLSVEDYKQYMLSRRRD